MEGIDLPRELPDLRRDSLLIFLSSIGIFTVAPDGENIATESSHRAPSSANGNFGTDCSGDTQ